MTQSSAPRIVLGVTRHDGLTETVELHRPIVTLGKLSTSTVTLDDPTVSRRHCVIECGAAGTWRITDLGSTHGTFLDDARIVQESLHAGQQLRIGQTSVQIVELSGAAERPAEPQPRPASARPTPIPARSFFTSRRSVDRSLATEGPLALDVALMLGDTLLLADRLPADQALNLGAGDGCQLFVPNGVLEAPVRTLVQPTAQGPVLVVHPEFRGELLADEALQPLEELTTPGRRVPLCAGAKVRICVGAYTILIGYERGPAALKTAGWAGINWAPMSFVVASAILHFLFLGAAQVMPEDPLSASLDPDQRRERLIEVLRITPEEAEERSKPPELPDDAPPVVADSPQLSLKDARGSSAEPAMEQLLNKLRRHRKTSKSTGTAGPLTRPGAKMIAQRTGAVAAMRANSSLLKQILSAERATGTELAFVDRGGALSADGLASETFGDTDVVDAVGPGWLSGGCPECKRDEGPGGGPIDGLGRPDGPTRQVKIIDRGPPKVKVVGTGRPKVSGTRSKKDVGRTIRRYMSGLRWCLSADVQAGRAESGRARIAFKIGPSGKTFGVAISGDGSSGFHSCVRKKVSRWRFGAVEQGGVATVNYPLILKVR